MEEERVAKLSSEEEKLSVVSRISPRPRLSSSFALVHDVRARTEYDNPVLYRGLVISPPPREEYLITNLTSNRLTSTLLLHKMTKL